MVAFLGTYHSAQFHLCKYDRPVSDPKIKAYFASWPWYQINPQYSDSMLTQVELANVQLLTKREADLANCC